MIKTTNERFNIRFAGQEDVQLILGFIKELAEYEKLSDQVVATEEVLFDSLFTKKVAEVIIGEYDGEPVGFALFYHSFSGFRGVSGIYLEDLFIRSYARGKGLGKIMLAYLGKLAIDRGCCRVEWCCLDWNDSSIGFYKSLGAKGMDDLTLYRVSGDNLDNLANDN